MLRLDLDADVSRWLGWNLRNPAHPDAPITLRMLLSHTGSVRDHDDNYAIPLGGTLRAVLGDPAAWDPAHTPGAGFFTYANLNFPIVGAIVFQLTKELFWTYLLGWQRVALGVLIVAVAVFFPAGIVGFVRERFGRKPGIAAEEGAASPEVRRP